MCVFFYWIYFGGSLGFKFFFWRNFLLREVLVVVGLSVFILEVGRVGYFFFLFLVVRVLGWLMEFCF